MRNYVELNRHFIDFSEEENSEEAIQRSYFRMFSGKDTNTYWNVLLKSKIIIVLGEAGSGKTWELREQARKNRDGQPFSFFIRLDKLVNNNLEDIIDNNDVALFDNWKTSNDKGIFFIDSVDETKLIKNEAFHDALQRFIKGIGSDNINRIQVVISGRVSEWRGQSDKFEVCKVFNIKDALDGISQGDIHIEKNDIEKKDKEFRIVLLAPLEESQVRKLADKHNLKNVDEFISQIEAKHAWEFVTRPLDAINLFTFWAKNKKLGNRQEIIEYTIPLKLKESEERIVKDEISLTQLREGAETLAAAVIFCKEYNIQIPDSNLIISKGALNIDILLANWTPVERKFLRNRSIFDGATYGHIRFHHRTTTEYLCASWLQCRMEKQLPYSELENILFVKSHEQWVVKPGFEAIAAWLATIGNKIWNNRILDYLIDNCPNVFLRFGEPHNFSKSNLIKLLNSIIKQYEGRKFVRLHTENYQFSAFAQPKIANEISRVILDITISDDIRCDLIIAIWRSQLVECSESLVSIIINEGDEELRRYAVLAIKDIASKEQLLIIYQAVSKLERIPSLFCAYLCEVLYPKVITPIQLWSLVEQSSIVSKNTSSDLPYYLSRIIKNSNIPKKDYKDLLKGVLSIVTREPHFSEHNLESEISVDFVWAGEVLLEIIVLILQEFDFDADLNALLVDGLILTESIREVDHHSYQYDKFKEKINKELKKHQELRRLYVLRKIDSLIEKDKELYLFGGFGYYAIITPQSTDMDWILDELKNTLPSTRYNKFFKLSLHWLRNYKYPSSVKRVIRKSALSRDMRKEFYKYNPIFIIRIYYKIKFKLKLNDRHYWKHRLWRIRTKAKKLYSYVYYRVWILSHVVSLRKGKYVGVLYDLTYYKNNDAEIDKHDWRNLIKPYGNYIAVSIRTGWVNSWRNYTPPLPMPHKRKTRKTEVGQAGIYNECLLGDLDFSKVNPDEAFILSRYAIHWMQGFPLWFPILLENNYKVVQGVLIQCVNDEWDYPAEKDHYYGIISQITHANKEIQKTVVSDLLERFLKSDPLNVNVLSYALKILLLNKKEITHQLSSLAELRLSEYKINDYQYLLWMMLFLQVDGVKAVLALKALQKNNNKELLTFVIELSSQLDMRHSSNKLVTDEPSYKNARILCDLIPIIYHYVNPQDDLDRASSGTFTPNQRDAAQSFREELLHLLATSNDIDTYKYLNELLVSPELELKHDYILHLIDNRIIHDAGTNVWEQEQIVEFENEHESKPRSNHDLFNLVCNRLLNIKDYIERHDSSIRNIFGKEVKESDLRKWLTEELNRKADKHYVVEQEVEVDLNKKPDIRISSPDIDPVSIEIKWADKGRSIKSLKYDLENQLVRQYMRTPNSNYGIFLIGNHGAQSYWKDPNDNSIQLSFDDVVLVLESHAIKLKEENSNVYGLSVIGIDFMVK